MGFILLCWFSVFPFLWRFVLLCLSKLKESPVLHKPWNGNVGILSSILPCSDYTAVVLSRQISCWISSIYHSYWNSTMHPVTMLRILELLWFCYSLQKKKCSLEEVYSIKHKCFPTCCEHPCGSCNGLIFKVPALLQEEEISGTHCQAWWW